ASLGVGSHAITATLTGSGGWATSVGGTAEDIQDGTSTALRSSPNPSTFGQSVTFTAVVTAADAGAGIPTGTVTFTEGATVLAANVSVDGTGHASFNISSLSIGIHTITANFTGTDAWLNRIGDDAS